jgi:hypothetical protein
MGDCLINIDINCPSSYITYFNISYFTFLFSLFVFVSAADDSLGIGMSPTKYYMDRSEAAVLRSI